MIQVSDQLFLEMKVKGERIPLNPSQIRKLKITEGVDYLVPTFEFHYDEVIPFFQELLPLTGMDIVEIQLAESIKGENLVTKHFRVMDYRPVGVDKGSSDAPAIIVKGLMDGVALVKECHRRSLSGLPSNIVKSVVNDITDNTFTEQTDSSLNETYIQPGWTNGKMIKYLRSKAYTTDGVGTYRSFFRFRSNTNSSDNREFIFKSLSGLYEEPRPEGVFGKLTYNPDQKKSSGSDQSDSLDNKSNNLITGFDWVNDSRRAISNGVLGFRVFGYDREEGGYVDQYQTVRGEDKHNHLAKKLFFGVDNEIDNYDIEDNSSYDGFSTEESLQTDADEAIMESSSDITELQLRVKGYLPKILAGTRVRVVITDTTLTGNQQQVISGDWLVKEKSEYIKGRVWTSLNLMRSGLNRPREQADQLPDAGNVIN